MQGEIVRFRKKLFGGFNRDDVTSYIAALAKERNESSAAAESAGREIERLEGEVSRLREKLGLYEKLIEKLRREARGRAKKPAGPHRGAQETPGAPPGTAAGAQNTGAGAQNTAAGVPNTAAGVPNTAAGAPNTAAVQTQKSVIKIIRKKI